MDLDIGMADLMGEMKKVKLVQFEMFSSTDKGKLRTDVNAFLNKLEKEGKALQSWGLYQFGKEYVIMLSYMKV